MSDTNDEQPVRRRRSGWSRFMILTRRVHLYAGLFLLPWVLLYGATGAMYNHVGLFPEVEIRKIAPSVIDNSGIRDFPAPNVLADRVVEALHLAADGVDIQIDATHEPQFTNDFMFEVHESGTQHVVEMDPSGVDAHIVTRKPSDSPDRSHIPSIHYIKLTPNPWETARTAAQQILDDAGIVGDQQPKGFGWTKLNFLARLEGQPVRITYVLKDGHIDIDPYQPDGEMPLRQFLLRMHTTHGQSPHWNGRMIWSVVVDVMAIAMVTWAITGVIMWWQIRRTRLIGFAVIALSIGTAAITYISLNHFYAATRM